MEFVFLFDQLRTFVFRVGSLFLLQIAGRLRSARIYPADVIQAKETNFLANKDGCLRLPHIVCGDTSKERLKRKGIEIHFMDTLRHPAKTDCSRENKQCLDQTADLPDDEVVKFLLCANTNDGFSCKMAYRHAGHVTLQIGST
jgi:hypothetical protein